MRIASIRHASRICFFGTSISKKNSDLPCRFVERGSPSVARVFQNAALQDGFDAVHRYKDAAANPQDGDFPLRDAVVESPNAYTQGLGGFCLRKRYGANCFGFLLLRWGRTRIRRKDLLEFLPYGSLDCCEKGLREFVEREDLATAVELKDEFQSHRRHTRCVFGAKKTEEEKLASRISSERSAGLSSAAESTVC